MSLYVGNDDTNNKVLHLTSSTHPSAELKTRELSDTVFHSNLNYVRVIKAQGNILNSVLSVSQATKDLIGTNGWIIIDKNKVNIPAIWGRSMNPDAGAFSPFYGKWDGLSLRLGRNATGPGPGGNNSYYDWIDIDSSHNGTCIIYIFSISTLDFNFTKIPTTNNEFLLGNGTISIRGFNILNSSYISTNIVNDIDDKVTILGKLFQFTNTNITENSVSLISNQSYSAIFRGGYPIIHSLKNSSMRYRGTKSIYLPSNPGQYANWNVVSASITFDEPLPENAFILCSLNALNNFPSDNNSFLFPSNSGELLFGRLGFNRLTHWKVSVQVTNTYIIFRSYFMVAGSYSILGNTYTIHIFY